MNNIENESSCELIQDLLPLYHDGVCSEKTRKIVEEHLKTCRSCGEMLKALDMNEAEEKFEAETQGVLKRHAKKEKTVAMKTGTIIAGLLMIPVIIALILTLPGYSDIKTDAVLIASMLLVAGMTVVPLISKTKKFSKTVIFSTIALLLIIFFMEMLFGDGGWVRFGEMAISVVFGLSVVFSPFIVRQADLPDTLRDNKALLTMGWDTIWFYLMMFIFTIDYPDSVKVLLGVSTFFIALAWLIFLTIRYLRIDGFFKAGITVVLLGIWTAVGNHLGWVTIYGRDVHTAILVVSIVAAALLTVIGIVRTNKSKSI